MNILLGITGGIAAYKTPDLVRRLRERGADVRVVMSSSAAEFVTATALQAVSGEPVRSSLWDHEAEAAMSHIELARWADLVLVAPATAEFLSKLATGGASDLLSTLCLATRAPIAIAPAMNHMMWSNPAVQANRATLEQRGVHILGPGDGDQACGETGPGRMLDVVPLADSAIALLEPTGPLAGRTVLITAGPTREAVDPVRYLTNRSSGKMGYALAAAARAAGARVLLVSGPVSLPTPAGVERIDVQTADEMYDAALTRAADADIFIGAAAVADYRPARCASSKIKKHTDYDSIALEKTRDILAAIAALPNGPFAVGFAAETERLREHAMQKFTKKNLDMIVANQVGENLAFDKDDNAVEVYWHGGEAQFDTMSKAALARELIELIATQFAARTSLSLVHHRE
jgi:phosphopantothenoylcysteine decarboxylase/phosphopantothenate--cysteine ligase